MSTVWLEYCFTALCCSLLAPLKGKSGFGIRGDWSSLSRSAPLPLILEIASSGNTFIVHHLISWPWYHIDWTQLPGKCSKIEKEQIHYSFVHFCGHLCCHQCFYWLKWFFSSSPHISSSSSSSRIGEQVNWSWTSGGFSMSVGVVCPLLLSLSDIVSLHIDNPLTAFVSQMEMMDTPI